METAFTHLSEAARGSDVHALVDEHGEAKEYLFGPFRFIPARRVLLCDNVPQRLGARAIDMLAILLERRNEPVSKRELIARVWPTTVVEECNVKVNIAALRRALGEFGPGTPYIATVNGRGYCFVAPLVARGRPAQHPAPGRPVPPLAPGDPFLASPATLERDAVVTVDKIKADLANAQAAHADALQLIARLRSQLRTSEHDAFQPREAQPAGSAIRRPLEQRMNQACRELSLVQASLDELNARHVDERHRLLERARLAEERVADLEQHALQEANKEYAAAAKLHETFKLTLAEYAAAIEQAHADRDAAQATITQVSEQISEMQHSVETLRNEDDRDRTALRSVRAQLEAAMRHAVVNRARTEHLHAAISNRGCLFFGLPCIDPTFRGPSGRLPSRRES